MAYNRFILSSGFLLLLACVGVGFPVAAAPPEALDAALKAGFKPHRAEYDIKLAGKKSGSQVVNISGQMVYEWQPACDAWISNHRFDLVYEYADSPSVRVESDFSTYESFDGESFNFTSQRKTNGQVFEELRGAATREEGKTLGLFSIPEGLSFDMPQDTYFPMAHTLAVLDKIKNGKKFFVATTFDGSDKEGEVEINTFMGKESAFGTTLKDTEGMDQDLLAAKAWDLRLAFFPVHRTESEADYEMDIVFHENGVISDMFIDYGSFSVKQKLTGLKPLGDACTTPASVKAPGLSDPDTQEQ